MAEHQSHGAGTYQKVFGPGKRRIRGLWKRNGAFYAQLKVAGEDGVKRAKRVRLEDKEGSPVGTLAAAIKAMAALTTKRDDDALELAPKRTPLFSDYAKQYFGWLDAVKDAKSPKTVQLEKDFVKQWNTKFPEIRVNAITPGTMLAYQQKRSADGVGARTINLELVAVRNVLKRATKEGLIRTVPKVDPLKVVTERRRLITAEEIDRLCTVAIDGWAEKGDRVQPINGQQFADCVRLMAYGGGRYSETISLRWDDIDFDRGQLHFRAKETKSSEYRTVDFNADLEAHLKAMHSRRAPDSDYLFPSPKFTTTDQAAQSFRGTLTMSRKRAKMPWFTAHLCRHYFISKAVMAGVDFMTIAAWVGHKDGGVLIGKVYGHLADEHRKLMAQRLTFAPQVVKTANREVAP